MRIQENFLSIIAPFSYEVWMCFLICIPLYVLAMSAMNYHFSGRSDWETVASTVIRGVLSECKSTNVIPPKHMYQKLLHLFWFWMMLVLISAYQGNLLALITRPTLNIPFTNAKDMVVNTQVEWVLADYGLLQAFLKNNSEGTTFRTLYDKAINSFSTCPPPPPWSGEFAMVMDIACAAYLIAQNFNQTGTCNFYLTQDRILASDSALAFPVS